MAAERALAKLLSNSGLNAKRVVRSGALKGHSSQMAGNKEDFVGDIQITLPDNTKLRVEVKTRQFIPRYIIRGVNKQIINDAYIVNLEMLLIMLNGKFIETGRWEKETRERRLLEKWFSQDSCDIVAMRQTRKHMWYFAIKRELFYKS